MVCLSLFARIFPILIFVSNGQALFHHALRTNKDHFLQLSLLVLEYQGLLQRAFSMMHPSRYRVIMISFPLHSFFLFPRIMAEECFLLLSATYFHHLVRSLYWSHEIGLVVAFILTTHLVVQLTWEPPGKFNLAAEFVLNVYIDEMSIICTQYIWTFKFSVEWNKLMIF